MPDPVTPKQNAPYSLELAPGKYAWCSCARSAKEPFCDGSHKGVTELKAVRFEVTEAGTRHLCGCKQSGTKPFCDGTHAKL
jgi:CDGSH-type Zn-finger protein